MNWNAEDQRPGKVGVGDRLLTGLECRGCEAVCEIVVFPWRCLKEARTCIYAFEDQDCVYVGCVHKVFSAEFDLAAFCDTESDRVAERDPYGAVKAVRGLRPQCFGSVERSVRTGLAGEACFWDRGKEDASKMLWDPWGGSFLDAGWMNGQRS